MSFLAKEAATRDFRLDAVHLAICLDHYGCLEPGAGGGTDAGAPGSGGGGPLPCLAMWRGACAVLHAPRPRLHGAPAPRAAPA